MTDETIDVFGGMLESDGASEPSPDPQDQKADEAPAPAESPEQPQPGAEPAPQESPAPQHETPQKAVEDLPRVGLDKYLDERRKRQDLEQQLQALKQKSEPPKVPDPYADPKGYHEYVTQTVQETEWRTRAEISGRFAEQKHGKDAVEAAITWAHEQGRLDPTFGARVRSQASPVEWIVDQYTRDQFFQKHGSDLSRLEALLASPGAVAPQQSAASPVPQPAPATPPSAPPPKSLAQTPSTGAGHQALPEGSVLDSMKFALD